MAWDDDYRALMDSEHLKAQAERLMPVLTMVMGTAAVPTLDHVHRDLAVSIMSLRQHPDSPMATSGPVRVLRDPLGSFSFGDEVTENYAVAVVSTTVYGMQLFMEAKKEPASEGAIIVGDSSSQPLVPEPGEE
jgi:hypothetical protein